MWLQYVQSMESNRLLNQALQYKNMLLQYVLRMDKNRLSNQALQYK